MHPLMHAKPYLRSAKLALLRQQARKLARLADAESQLPPRVDPPPCFIVACGRSGTTLLGGLMGEHPEIAYLREPYHLWAAIDNRLDVTNLHGDHPDARLYWSGAMVAHPAPSRFNRLILGHAERRRRRVVLEKTPHNAFRVPFIDTLCKRRARFVHLVRNGHDVAMSIARLATRQPYRLAWRPRLNQWWGADEHKWKRLAAEGGERGLLKKELDAIAASHEARGAYEWVASILAVDEQRARLGERLLELKYDDLTSRPELALERVASHFGVGCDESWVRSAASEVDEARRNRGSELSLPPALCAEFNGMQERFGFCGRARVA